MTLVLAHAGHWVEGLAFAVPVVVVPAGLGLVVLRDRLRARRGDCGGVSR